MSDSARVAQSQAGAEIYRETVKLLTELAKNPIVELVVAWALVEKLQANGVIGPIAAGTMEAGIGAIITAQQIAPLMPDIIKAGQGIGGALGALAVAAPK